MIVSDEGKREMKRKFRETCECAIKVVERLELKCRCLENSC